MSGFLQPIARSGGRNKQDFNDTVRHSRAFLRHNICQATVLPARDSRATPPHRPKPTERCTVGFRLSVRNDRLYGWRLYLSSAEEVAVCSEFMLTERV